MLAPVARAADPAQKTFDSPEAGVAALVAAVEANDVAALRAILGTHGETLFSSGDAVADGKYRAAFSNAYRRANTIEATGDALATLVIGKDRWPLAIPLVKSNGAWYFDTQKGEQEILDRRIGRNELATIQVCLAIVDAQRDYVAKDRDSNGLLEYASKFVSTPGMHDGLYWEPPPGESPSPLGPLLAAAAKGGYASANPFESSPYHGYFFRILTQQGKDAPGGAYDYLVRGKLIGGFAVVAYPARYGVSGVMTFIVNHNGAVYQKDLGKNTAVIAAALTSFNPDPSWKRL
ncbi:MAG TPA: DUF2950 domain-containing protein [Burkholderiales bacterium]|nr:DUF2950 domain-containing protein [Burkholderiales bacterium]